MMLRDYNVKPFQPGPVTNIVTGKEIDSSVIDGLLSAADKGDVQYTKFVEDRLINESKSFFDTITKNKINTGIEKKKTRSKKVDILLEEKQAFGVMVSKCNSKEEAFSCPMTSLPLSIANPDGFLYSSDKAKFRNDLISDAQSEQALTDAIWIIDMGYAIRQIKPRETYKQFCGDLLDWSLPHEAHFPKTVVMAVDNYKKESTKDGERKSRRGGKMRENIFMFQGLIRKCRREK